MYYFGKLLLFINYIKVFKLCENNCYDYIININKSRKFTDKLINIMFNSLNKKTINIFNKNLKLNYDISLRMSYYG